MGKTIELGNAAFNKKVIDFLLFFNRLSGRSERFLPFLLFLNIFSQIL